MQMCTSVSEAQSNSGNDPAWESMAETATVPFRAPETWGANEFPGTLHSPVAADARHGRHRSLTERLLMSTLMTRRQKQHDPERATHSH